MNKRLGSLAVALGLAVTALYGLGRAVAMTSVAQAAGILAGVAAPPGPDADPRWLQLVRSLAAGPGGNAPASAGPTMDYLITDQFVVGHVPLANTVIISLTRGGSLVATQHLNPIPDAGAFLYATSLLSSIYVYPPIQPMVGTLFG